jgi:hypothetical protein
VAVFLRSEERRLTLGLSLLRVAIREQVEVSIISLFALTCSH